LIQLSQADDEISLVVEDDGRGFDVSMGKAEGGLGLGSLQNRVNLLKGFLDIASSPGEGTTVTVNFKAKLESDTSAGSRSS
jgi:signal transduction histidine kinase